MPIFFTVDRRRTLVAGTMIQLQSHAAANHPSDVLAHANELFPAGVSAHGQSYFNGLGQTDLNSRNIELIWEFVRRSRFADKPSRLTSFFAWQTLDDARRFAGCEGVDAPIYKVMAESPFVADMSLLHCDSGGVRISQLAHLYWQGESGVSIAGLQAPVWEVLLSGPVHVLERVIAS